MATIKLETMPDSMIIAAKYDVYVDGQNMNMVRSEKIKALTVAAGAHTIYVHAGSNSSRSLSFDIDETETKTFGVGLSAGSRTARGIGLMAGMALIIMGLMIGVGSRPPFGVVILVAILPVPIFIYNYSTRDRFFTITELENHDS